MKARLLVDATTSNPEYDPPDFRDDPVAFQLYRARVPHSLPIKAGTVVEGHDAYLLCVPNDSRVILAEPADEECEEMLAHEVKNFSREALQVWEKHKRLQASKKASQEAAAKVKAKKGEAPAPAPSS